MNEGVSPLLAVQFYIIRFKIQLLIFKTANLANISEFCEQVLIYNSFHLLKKDAICTYIYTHTHTYIYI
jgi:hypothetical protein